MSWSVLAIIVIPVVCFLMLMLGCAVALSRQIRSASEHEGGAPVSKEERRP